jgi:hypothetical protein
MAKRSVSRKSKSSDQKGNKDPSTTGKKTWIDGDWPMLSPDHPLFTRGFVIGMRRSGSSSATGAATASDNAKPPTSQPENPPKK